MRYLEQYQAMHAAGAFNSRSISQWLPEIALLVRRHDARTLLDYGCGSGNAYLKDRVHKTHFRGVMPTLYDPGAAAFSAKPEGRFDGVICADVLEHVPEDELPALIEDLAGYAGKFLFASVCCRPAKKTFPDGTNLHVTVRPFRWWCDLFAHRFPVGPQLMLREAL